VISAVSVDLSTSVWMLVGRIDCWSSSVDAADIIIIIIIWQLYSSLQYSHII